MLRMPPFELHLPRTAEEAVRACASLPSSMYVAGGTDLLPNLKHGLHRPEHLVSLASVQGLDQIEQRSDGTIRIGARCTLHQIASSDALAREVPGLPLAASLVAGPQHRRMGTIGGNVMLDTRCLFYNQSEHWRASLGRCLKAEGSWCHVIGSAKGCVAAQSSDTVPVLTALGASIEALHSDGTVTTTALSSLWTKDGRFDRNRTLPPGALLTAIVIPPRPQGHRSTYRKVRSRAAVDFPQLGVAASASFEGERCTSLEIVIGAMLPHPKQVSGLELAIGVPWTDALIDSLAELAFKSARPQTQIHGDPSWRRQMVRVEARRALQQIRG